jgi:hypothetical protein
MTDPEHDEPARLVADAAAVAPAGLDWRAIALGAAGTLAVGMLAPYLLLQVLMRDSGMVTDTRWFALWPLIGLLADGLGGAIAGLLARRRGAMHGALASAVAAGGGMVISIGRLAFNGAVATLASPAYWVQVLAWTANGIGVAAVAGLVAARTAASASVPRE